jgi:outer membrane cobalamin receptor
MTISRISAIFVLALLVVCISSVVFSQEMPADTTNPVAMDTIKAPPVKPIPLVGTLDRYLPQEQVITDSMINFMNYRYPGDVAALVPSVLVRDFGSLGLLPDFTIGGIGGKNIAFLSDGVLLNDPLTGLFNPYLYPTEIAERIEIVSGTRAFLYGLNGTGGAINFIDKSKKAIKPYSRLRYTESGYGFGIVDGMVSQDVIRRLNVTMGAQHTVYGQRLENENYDCWNARVKARYNINNNINVFTSEMYNQSLLGMYGGVDLNKTADSLRYDVLQATVRNAEAYEKLARHDVQFGAAARLLPDSEAISTLTLYYTSTVRGYRDRENRSSSNGIYIDQWQHARWFGIKATQNTIILNQRFDFGADLRTERIHLSPATAESSATPIALWGKGEFSLLPSLTLSPYARYDGYRGQHLLSYGGDLTVPLLQNVKIFGGYSRSYRIPTYVERMGIDTLLSTTIMDNEPERHHLIEAGFCWSNNDWISFNAKTFYRTIWNPITVGVQSRSDLSAPYEFTRHSKKIIQGFASSLSLRVSSFYLEGEVQFLEMIDHQDNRTTFPKWSGTGGLYYWDELIRDHLNLKAGICGKIYSGYYGEEFNQQAQLYLPNGMGYDIPATNEIDLVILAHIGSAYIHFIIDNLLDRNYIMTSFYPMPERQMRFGVSWEFLN